MYLRLFKTASSPTLCPIALRCQRLQINRQNESNGQETQVTN